MLRVLTIMNRIPTLLFCAVLICLASCKRDSSIGGPISTDACFVSPSSTKTALSSDGSSVRWSAADAVALWAVDGNGQKILNAQKFIVYALDDERAVFTSTLTDAMPEGNYEYVAAYPMPSAVSGSISTFKVPSNQDGRAVSGEDVMISSKVQASELGTMAKKSMATMLDLEMHHLVHLLKFYLPEDGGSLDGEPVERIVFSLPGGAAGSLKVNADDPQATPVYERSLSSVSLNLAAPLESSSEAERKYAFAAVLPAKYNEGDVMNVRLLSKHYSSKLDPIDLKGRTLEAGHSTPVALKVKDVEPFYHVIFNMYENNIGEPVRKITLTAPAGCKWGDGGSNVYTFEPGEDINVGSGFEIMYYSGADFRTLSSKTVTVTFDSEHVIAGQTVTLPSLLSVTGTDVNLKAPYLLNEDFSAVESFSSNDEYGTWSTGDKEAVSFLSGWTAGRAGGSAGKCVRLAGRRETSARYHSRMDSAPLPEIKSPVDLEVSFNYGTNNKFGGIGSGDYGSDTYIGYVTEQKAYSSGDDTGVFEKNDNKINTNAKDGSYDSTPNFATFVLHNVAAGKTVRITWRNMVENHAGTNNTTTWFYLDNVKVKVKQK